MIETQHPAEPLKAFNCTGGRFCTIIGLDQPIVDSLVIPLPVVMSDVLASRLTQRLFTEEDHPVETLVLS